MGRYSLAGRSERYKSYSPRALRNLQDSAVMVVSRSQPTPSNFEVPSAVRKFVGRTMSREEAGPVIVWWPTTND